MKNMHDIIEWMNLPRPWIGHSSSEMERIKSMASFPLPNDYLAFISSIGRTFDHCICEQGDYMDIDNLPEVQTDAKELLTRAGINADLLNDKFVFLMHQGHLFYCLDSQSNVYIFQGKEEGLARKFTSFSEWLCQFALSAYEAEQQWLKSDIPSP